MIKQPVILNSTHGQLLIRRLTVLAFDGLLIVMAFLGAFALRLQDRQALSDVLAGQLHLLPLAVASGLSVLFLSGWYRGLTRYAGSHSLYGLVPRATTMVLVFLLISTLIGGQQPPRSFWLLYWLLFTSFSIGSRIVLRDLLILHLDRQGPATKEPADISHALIYGAGPSGLSLLLALRNDPRFRVFGFLDDETLLHGRTLQNLRIDSPARLPELIKRQGIRQVLLAMPEISRHRKRLVVDALTNLGLKVLSIPSLAQLASGQRIVTDLQQVSIEELLGREPSNPDPHLLEVSVRGKAVLVTGAGGSIGSELCRQILALGASKLVMLERNEYALYSIGRELRSSNSSRFPSDLHAILGDVADTCRLIQICRDHAIATIFHAAAYKHVPLIEQNLCIGVANNMRATRSVVEAASQSQVKWVSLMSSDKAVRPTNAMGATKRLSELIFQAAAADSGSDGPIYSVVRFGNVLGSSGSVIPLFHEQIANGGPVTVTHPEMTRYFMTTQEAVQLVLQSTALSTGGDVFLLDMGDQVLIVELARKMIELSGLKVRDKDTPDGDITIQFTGLRPGEKLYEELLISGDAIPTTHPLIWRVNEPFIPSTELLPMLQQLEHAIDNWNRECTLNVLRVIIPEFVSNENLVA